jgi:hypothetical protein
MKCCNEQRVTSSDKVLHSWDKDDMLTIEIERKHKCKRCDARWTQRLSGREWTDRAKW